MLRAWFQAPYRRLRVGTVYLGSLWSLDVAFFPTTFRAGIGCTRWTRYHTLLALGYLESRRDSKPGDVPSNSSSPPRSPPNSPPTIGRPGLLRSASSVVSCTQITEDCFSPTFVSGKDREGYSYESPEERHSDYEAVGRRWTWDLHLLRLDYIEFPMSVLLNSGFRLCILVPRVI